MRSTRVRRGAQVSATGVMAMGALMAMSSCGFVSMDARGTWVDEASGVELNFTQEGLISGTDGCNTVKGTWEEHGQEVTIHLKVDQEGDCSDVDLWLVDPASAVVDVNTMTIYGPQSVHLGELTEQ